MRISAHFFALALITSSFAVVARAQVKDYSIKLTRPPKVGQKYELVAEGAITRTTSFVADEKNAGAAGKAVMNQEEYGVRLEGTCEVLEVNRDGEEGKVACTVKKCIRITAKGDAELVPAGRVITATGGKEDTTFKLDKGRLSPDASEALDLVLRMGEDDGYNDDKIYGTKQRQPVGGTWPVDAKAASDEAKDDGVIFEPKDITASLKLDKIETVDGIECMRITGTTDIKDVRGEAPEKMTFVKGTLKAKYSALYPVDEKIGTLAESMSLTHFTAFHGEPGPDGKRPLLASKVQRASDVKRKFLPTDSK